MTKNKKAEEPKYNIAQSDAMERISIWQEDQKKIITALAGTPGDIYSGLPMLRVKAFSFNLDEIQALVKKIDTYNEEHPESERVNAVRFYLGVKIHPNEPVAPKPCLVGVGVSGFDPNNSIGGDDIISLEERLPGQADIYDFSYPCPSTCANAGASIMDVPNA